MCVLNKIEEEHSMVNGNCFLHSSQPRFYIESEILAFNLVCVSSSSFVACCCYLLFKLYTFFPPHRVAKRDDSLIEFVAL